MPKMKTHRGAAKRLRKTGSGKLKRNIISKSASDFNFINPLAELI